MDKNPTNYTFFPEGHNRLIYCNNLNRHKARKYVSLPLLVAELFYGVERVHRIFVRWQLESPHRLGEVCVSEAKLPEVQRRGYGITILIIILAQPKFLLRTAFIVKTMIAKL
jgi:hypothetical protein